MEKIEIDITKAFIDGERYKLYIQSYLDDDLTGKQNISVRYKDELNKEYKPGQNFVNFEVADDTIVGFKGVLAVDLWQGRILNSRGYELSGNNIESFINHPYEYRIQLNPTEDPEFLKDMMVDSGMISEDEWSKHTVEPVPRSTGVILATYPETLGVRFGCWYKHKPHKSDSPIVQLDSYYAYRELTIPLSKLFGSYYMHIYGGTFYDKPVFDPIKMKEKEKK